MSDNNDLNSKPSSNLNIPSITKQLSDLATSLNKSSFNVHKQLETSTSLSNEIAKSTSVFEGSLENFQRLLTSLDSSNGSLSATNSSLLSIKKNISSDISQLQSMSDDLKAKVVLLSNLHIDLNAFLRSQHNQFHLSLEDFNKLVDLLNTHSSSLNTISSRVDFLNNHRFSTIEQSLASLKSQISGLSNDIHKSSNDSSSYFSSIKKRFWLSFFILALFLIPFSYASYYTYYIYQSLDKILRAVTFVQHQIDAITPTPTPNKSDKKNSK